jgi:hypothetical protein
MTLTVVLLADTMRDSFHCEVLKSAGSVVHEPKEAKPCLEIRNNILDFITCSFLVVESKIVLFLNLIRLD